MRLGQGRHRRSPRWVSVLMISVAICILPGAALVVAQPPENNSASPRTGDATPTVLDPDSADDFSIRRYIVQDLLHEMVQDGVSEQQAGKRLLQFLPAVTAQPHAKVVQRQNRPEPNPRLAARALPKPIDGKAVHDKTVRTISEGSLVVQSNGRTHAEIQKTLERFRAFGFKQVLIKMTFLRVQANSLELLKRADRIGVSKQSDALHGHDGGTVNGAGVMREIDVSAAISFDSVVAPTQSVAKVPATHHAFGVYTPAISMSEVEPWVRSLVEDRGASVLSRPQIMTSNGQAASIQTGRRISVGTTEGDRRSVDHDRQVADAIDVGLKSVVVPNLQGDSEVELDLNIELTEADDARSESTESEPDGNVRSISLPIVSRVTLESQFKAKLKTPVVIVGPTQMVSKTSKDGAVGRVAEQIVVVITCEAISPFKRAEEPKARAPRPETTSATRKAADAQSGAKVADDLSVKSTGGVVRSVGERAEEKMGVVLSIGKCSIHVNGDVYQERKDNSTIVVGKDVFVRAIYENSFPRIRASMGRWKVPDGVSEKKRPFQIEAELSEATVEHEWEKRNDRR